MLESKFALNNLNFKCYLQFFLSEHELDQKNGGVNLTSPPGNPRMGQHPGKGGVNKSKTADWAVMYIVIFVLVPGCN